MDKRVLKAIQTCKKDIGEITLETKIREDLEFDSFDTLMLISELEDGFNVNIDERHFEDVSTVGDIIDKLRGEGIC